MVKQVRIYDMNVKYETVHRDIKYPRLEFKTGELLLVLPKNYKEHEVLIEKHKGWIYEKKSFIEKALKATQKKELDLERTDEEFRNIVRACVKDMAHRLKVRINKIYFRRMKSKWGSCNSKKNLTINTFLKYLPKNLIEYVIFHEMAHLLVRKHNERFWNIISSKFNDYQKKEKELLVYWFLIQKVIAKS